MAFILMPLFFAAVLVEGTANTWTDGVNTWAGNPFCAEAGFLLAPGSPAIDQGARIEGLHCPEPGSALNQPVLADGSYCLEWAGKNPDIGACERVELLSAPTGLVVN